MISTMPQPVQSSSSPLPTTHRYSNHIDSRTSLEMSEDFRLYTNTGCYVYTPEQVLRLLQLHARWNTLCIEPCGAITFSTRRDESVYIDGVTYHITHEQQRHLPLDVVIGLEDYFSMFSTTRFSLPQFLQAYATQD